MWFATVLICTYALATKPETGLPTCDPTMSAVHIESPPAFPDEMTCVNVSRAFVQSHMSIIGDKLEGHTQYVIDISCKQASEDEVAPEQDDVLPPEHHH